MSTFESHKHPQLQPAVGIGTAASKSTKTRAALHRDVRLISTECCHLLGLEITKEAMDIVAELVYAKIALYGTDLEAFAKHAKRSVVNAEDVKLLVRRNPSLKTHLNSLPSANPVATKEKRRKTMPVAKQRTPPAKKILLSKPSPVSTDAQGTSSEIPNDDGQKVLADDAQSVMEDDAQKMVIDDAIDLTFDD